MINLIQKKPTAEEVKALREKAGLPQTAFAELIGLSNRQLIGDYETGKKTPSAQTWTLMLLATNQHPSFKLDKNKEFNMIIDTKSKQIEVAVSFIDAPFEVINDIIKCGINLSINDKDFICTVEKSDKFKLVDFPSDIKTYLLSFYDIRDFGDEDDRYTQDYLDEAVDSDLLKVKQMVIDKAKEVINNYLESK